MDIFNKKRDYSKYKPEIFFLAAIISFVICYGLVFNMTVYNGDSLIQLTEPRQYLGNGRFLGRLLIKVVGHGTYNPIITSIITFITMFITSLMLMDLFAAKRMRTELFIIFAVFSFPISAVYWQYGHDMWLYSLAITLSICGMYFALIKEKYSYSIISFVLALSIYQISISVATVIFSSFFILRCLNNEVDIKKMLKVIFTVFLSALIYYLIFKIGMHLTGMEITTYKGANEIGIKTIISDLPANILGCYKYFIVYISGNVPYFDYFHLKPLWVMFNLMYLIPSLYCVSTKNTMKNKLVTILLLVTLPIAFNSQLLITSDYTTRTIFGALPFTVFIIVIILEYLPTIKFFNVFFVTIILLFNLNSTLAIEQSDIQRMTSNEQFVGSVILDLQRYPTFTKDSQIGICGTLYENNNLNKSIDYPYVFGEENYITEAGPAVDIFQDYDQEEIGQTLNQKAFEYYGLAVSVVPTECDEDAPQYPEEGYIYEYKDIININYSSKKEI